MQLISNLTPVSRRLLLVLAAFALVIAVTAAAGQSALSHAARVKIGTTTQNLAGTGRIGGSN